MNAHTPPPIELNGNTKDMAALRYSEGRLIGLRVNRYSWWTHWRELADYFLPRRYKWIITPNMMARGSPINQHILDSTGVICARNLASGLVSGKSSPTRPWFKLRIGHIDSTQTSPVSLWLAECERLLYLIFSESNFYNTIAQFYFDLVIFGTASMLVYEDYENVINCINPCAGEYYIDIDGKYRPTIFYREFTLTVDAVVREFGYDNCSASVQQLYRDAGGANRTRELIIAHSIEPNDDGNAEAFGIPSAFAFREFYWEWGGTASPQGSNFQTQGFLRKKGYFEQPNISGRWDIVSNDAYGRSPAMDALPDQKQLQLSQKRKAQAIDKMVNPPLVADVQLKNQPASLLPGGMTYVSGFTTSGKPGIASVYDTKFPVAEMVQDLEEVRQRLGKIFFNDVLMTASQFETRSNVTAVEWNMRKSESMVALGPALDRIDFEVLSPMIERVFGIASRAGILPPAPPEIAGQMINITYISMLKQAQDASASSGIEDVLRMAGELVATKPEAMDNIDVDYALDKYSYLRGNDPKLIRSPQALVQIRQNRAQQQQAAQQAAIAEQLSKGAVNLSGAGLIPRGQQPSPA
jgi:Bacteriophage head to tail connecting protein